MISRTSYSIKNVKYALIGQAFGLVISFLSRTVFVRVLSAEYLGINGLFSNILSILSLAELGVGQAIVFSMYKPLAERNESKIVALMGLYRKAYSVIGIVVSVLGVALLPFLRYFVQEMPDIPYIRLIYIIFVANSVVSYFFSYKRSLIIADQKGYIATIYRYGFYFVLNVAQIIALLLTRSYLLYLGLQLANTIVENVLVSKKADALYPFLNQNKTVRLDGAEKRVIIRNTTAMVFHRVGGIVVSGTDNILLSKLVGVTEVGLYSNYLLVVNALHMILGMFFQSITASVGNLGATESKRKQRFVFDCVNFVGFWAYGFVSICLLSLLNPFIQLWLGKDYVLSLPVVMVIVVNFYLNGMRKSVLTFRDSLGLYWHDRYKPIFESLINLAVSIYLGKRIGTAGILLGTTISTVTTCFWIEPYVLYRRGFHSSVMPYFKQYIRYSVGVCISGSAVWLLNSVLEGVGLTGTGNFLARLTVGLSIPNVMFMAFFHNSDEYRYLWQILINKAPWLRRKC